METPNRDDQRPDPTAETRKRDHIAMAFDAQVLRGDARFFYEPMMAAHPDGTRSLEVEFLGRRLSAPIWVSSMTGGTEWAGTINRNLARVCGEYGLGMGLGSCRMLLDDLTHLPDFAVRGEIGPDLPLYANLGIAQLEALFEAGQSGRIVELIKRLEADGLIVHVNPLQEWLQPEGDRFAHPPIDTVKRCLDLDIPIIVKEVGQGMGPESLRALLSLPIAALDFGALGGTNFALLEMMRHDEGVYRDYNDLAHVGHTALEMTELTNRILAEMGGKTSCRQIIVSGGVKHFLDGYYLLEKLSLPAVYGQASGFLKYARGDYEILSAYVSRQIEGLRLAKQYLRIRG